MTSTTETSDERRELRYPFNSEDGLELNELYKTARERGLIRIRMAYGEPAWLISRYEDVRFVLSDRRFSRAAEVTHDEPRGRAAKRGIRGILTMDPPEHTHLRKLIGQAFTIRRVEALRPRVAEIAGGLLAEMNTGGGPVDLVENFALSIPIQVICELLGVPVGDRDRFRKWSVAFVSTSLLTAEEFGQNLHELTSYMAELIAEKRRHPADDLISALIAAREEGNHLSEEELVNVCCGVLVAGHETTATEIANFVYVLLSNREVWEQMVSDQTLLEPAVEELLRFIPVGTGGPAPRYAIDDAMVGDTLIRKGDAVIVSLGSANRDPRQFEDPDTIDLNRPHNAHVTLGHGPHYCVGAALARLELQEALRALTVRMPDLTIAAQPVWKHGEIFRGPSELLVSW